MTEKFRRVFGRSHCEDGASAVEYGLLVAAIAALIVIVVFALGGIVQGLFKDTCDKIKNQASAATTCVT